VQKIVLIGAASLALFVPAAKADQMNVGDLQMICAGREVESTTACRFFVLGVVEGASFGEGRKTAGGPLCIREGIAGSDLVSTVKRAMTLDLQAFPQDKNIAAAGFVAAAAMKAYPCKR
jgi:hypothetical protein